MKTWILGTILFALLAGEALADTPANPEAGKKPSRVKTRGVGGGGSGGLPDGALDPQNPSPKGPDDQGDNSGDPMIMLLQEFGLIPQTTLL